MKRMLKDFMPPMLVKVAKGSRGFRSIFYNTYSDAARACADSGYQAADLVDLVIEKNIRFQTQLKTDTELDLGALRTMIGLGAMVCRNKGKCLNILDFGGGGGYHYFIAKSFLGKDCILDWKVIETEAMAAGAAKSLGSEELKFFSRLPEGEAGSLDLAFTSSALQYAEDPQEILRKLVMLKARYLFITRTPFHLGAENLITVQESKLSANGPGPMPLGLFIDRKIKYPVTFVSQNSIEKIILEKYKIRFRIDEGDGGFLAGNRQLVMTGYFCELLDN
jgi:putative methyltransferase (TIGR04325 family)